MRAGLIAAGLAAALILTPWGEAAREAATDSLMRAVPRPDAGAPVLAVAITDSDLAALGAWPWPRERMAALIERLAGAGAVAIALDILFAEPSPGDAALSAALVGAPVVLAALGGTGPARTGFGTALLNADVSQTYAFPGLEASDASLPAPSGFAALPGETVRAVPLVVRAGDTVVPGFAAAAVARAVGADTLILRGNPPAFQLGPFALIVPPDFSLRLHPTSRPVPAMTFASIMEDPAPARGRVIIVGVTATAVAAPRASVFGALSPALRIHAEAASQLAAGWVPLRPGWAMAVELVAALGLGTLAAWLTGRGTLAGLAAALIAAACWVGGAGMALGFGPLLLDPMLPAIAPLAAALIEALWSAVRAARERATLMARFVHRLPPGVFSELLSLPNQDRLRPERRAATVVLTDLAGFTAMLQRSDPAQVLPVLNAYLAGIEAVGTGHGGVPERLTGDGVLLVFGAPAAQADHAARALAAARGIDAFTEGFRRLPDAVMLGWGPTRISVASGEVLAGEVGGARVTWTVYGDAVNVASRLQDLARQTGDRVLVTGIDDPSLKPRGKHQLRGRDGEVSVAAL